MRYLGKLRVGMCDCPEHVQFDFTVPATRKLPSYPATICYRCGTIYLTGEQAKYKAKLIAEIAVRNNSKGKSGKSGTKGKVK